MADPVTVSTAIAQMGGVGGVSIAVAPVERVELFEDRASITRRVAVRAAGRQTIAIDGVTPLVSERALVFPSVGFLVEEASVVRERVLRSDADPSVAADLQDRADATAMALAAARDRVDRASQSLARAQAALDAAAGWTPRALLGTTPVPAWVDAYDAVAKAREDAALAHAEAELAVESLEREHDDAVRRLQAARQGTLAWRCRLVLRVVAEAPGDLRVRYTVPCALWRPVHRAVLNGAGRGARLRWEVGAMAWNATGEDWSQVALVCSTARPGGHAAPPVLVDDVVRSRRKDKEVVVQAREEVVQVAREGEARKADEVPGVEDGGEPRTFTAPGPVDLPSTGRPVHVRLESWEADAEVAWIAHPEQSGQVVLRSRQTNAGTRPLLGGPVDLVRDAGAVGRGRVGFVPPGEPFHLGWGSHDAVRVTRRSDHKVDRTRITGFQTHRFQVTSKVANLGDEAVAVEIRERVPVSEIAEVKVPAPQATPALASGPDADGLCSWRLTVEPGTTQTLTLTYTVEAPASVRLPWPG